MLFLTEWRSLALSRSSEAFRGKSASIVPCFLLKGKHKHSGCVIVACRDQTMVSNRTAVIIGYSFMCKYCHLLAGSRSIGSAIIVVIEASCLLDININENNEIVYYMVLTNK